MNLTDAFVFLPVPPESSFIYIGTYDPLLVLLSIFIAIFAALAALDVADRIRHAVSPGAHLAWLMLGALALGGGIWAMHFIGMLAFQLPCRVRYDAATTLWSMLPGVFASAVAIEVVRHARLTQARLLLGSLLLGGGIGAMHYTGMAAMHIDGLVRYNPKLFALSIIVAVVLAFFALQIRYGVRHPRWRIPVAAGVMGLAVSGMHYTAMAATYFLRAGDPSIPDSVLEPSLLATVVSIITGLLIALALVTTVAARHQETARRLRDSEYRIRQILESTQEGFVQVDTNRCLIEANPSFCEMLGRPRDELLGHPLVRFLAPESIAVYEAEMLKRAEGLRTSYEVALQRPDGTLRHCQFHGTPVLDQDGEQVGAFALITDITDRKAHEAYVRRAVAVFENTGEGVMLTDPGGNILSVNPAFKLITGFDEEEVRGENPALLSSGRHGASFYHQMWAEISTTGHWQGEIWNRRKNGEVYPQWLTISAVRDQAGRVENYVGVFSDISHIKRSAEEMERLAHFDPLTDLANRLLLGVQLKHALERATRYNERLAVMEIDLDGFKTVNDTLGHPAGDTLLQVVAGRLKQALRAEDVIARLGGDEFAVIVESVEAADDVARIAEKLIEAIGAPVELDGQMSRVTGSIGIAFYPEDGRDATTLMKAADTAMYVSKRDGRNTYRFYADDMARAVQRRHVLEQGLRLAMDRDELELWYQPQIHLTSGQVVGVEALVRWRHPERGVISPAEFLPVASDTGLIVPLGDWVLLTACHQAQAWRQTGIDLQHVAVNVDGQQIVRSDFVDTVNKVLAATGLPPGMLELEVTESFLLENAENGMGTVMRFADMGVNVAIDDFGTGYSSLVYLKYLHADTLKIDKCFVGDLPDDSTSAAIIHAVVSLGHGLGFNLVAEGVETAEQLAYLQKVGCDRVQGYYFAKPMPVPVFEDWLKAYRPPT